MWGMHGDDKIWQKKISYDSAGTDVHAAFIPGNERHIVMGDSKGKISKGLINLDSERIEWEDLDVESNALDVESNADTPKRSVTALAISNDGNNIVCGTSTGDIIIWEKHN